MDQLDLLLDTCENADEILALMDALDLEPIDTDAQPSREARPS